MKIKSARFLLSAEELSQCPPATLPEVAFIGRSNVGKSSLVNCLCQQKALARVSSKPGHTRLVNFFAVNEAWVLVDLPGYGYAKVAKAERHRFQDLAADYLERREGLVRVYALIDSRLDPQRIDLDFLRWLGDTRRPHSLVFTKSDKLKPGRVRANRDRFLEALAAETGEDPPPSLLFSSASGEGRRELLADIAARCAGM